MTQEEAEARGIDYKSREQCLDDAAFQACFGVDKAAFAAMPLWKRKNVKKKVGLF